MSSGSGDSSQGVRRLAFYCDESGISGNCKYYGFGSLIMLYQRRGDFVREFRALANGRDWGEVKWNSSSKANLAYYKRLVDYFFRTPSLFFHCIVVKRSWVNIKKFHEGSFDLARRKHFTQFLANKVKSIRKRNPGRDLEFRVYVDPIASSYDKADEAVHLIANRIVDQTDADLSPLVEGAKLSPIKKVLEVDSKGRPEVQLCDLLLGAVVDSWNQNSTAEHKTALKRYVASHVGWTDLNRTTFGSERKFNVWYLTDSFKNEHARPVRASPVRLTHPLPRR